MNNLKECQAVYDNMTPEDDEHRERNEDLNEESDEDFEVMLARKKQAKTGRYHYTPEEAEALNRLGW